MVFPYMTQRIARRPLAAILLLSLNLVAALLMCILHTGALEMTSRIDEVYDNTSIICQVSNLTGTQTEGLDLPEWVIRLFMGNSNVPNASGVTYLNDESMEQFRSYISDVHAKVSVPGQYMSVNISLIGVTDPGVERTLQEEFGGILWDEGYDDAVFSGEEALCIVPENVRSGLPPETEYIDLVFWANEQPFTQELRIVGSYTGADTAFYCPWSITTRLNQQIDGHLHANSIYATLKDSRKTGEFLENAAGNFFVEPNPKGEQTLWPDSAAYVYYPFALLVNNAVLEETVAGLKNNIRIFRLCTAAITVLSLILGFVIGHLIVRQRTKNLALQRILGQSNGYIFAESWLELTAVTLVGMAAGTALGWIFGGKEFPWAALAASLAFYATGFASAIFSILHTDLIRSIKEDA